MSRIESTFKDRDLEETLDIYFYRPIGYCLALLGKSLRLTPNFVTISSMVIGVMAGHFFYYPSLRWNILGMGLLIFSEALDSADGQLARITESGSKLGRILDGLAGNVIFLSIYVHIFLRSIHDGSSWTILPVVIVASTSHSFQTAIADYYRNTYLYYVRGPGSSEFESSHVLTRQHKDMKWRESPVKKFLFLVYLIYVREQELLTSSSERLKAAVREQYGKNNLHWLSQEYKSQNQTMIKYYNILTANTRMLALFLFLFLNKPYLYLVFEIVVLNGLLVYVVLKENKINRQLICEILSGKGKD